MMKDEVLAVVVSYNGLGTTTQTVTALLDQVARILIVDNGSDRPSLDALDALEGDDRVSVIRLSENRGIGHALNLGVRRAKELGYAWLLTMDQDSVVDRAMIDAYEAAVARNPERVCLAPAINGGDEASDERDAVVGYAITSGNLVRVSLFDQIGPYDEGFFIDCIDFDFSLRLRRAGHAVHRVPTARMQHRLGDADAVPAFLRRYYAQHSAVRRYYMYRNFLYMVERYGTRFPLFIAKLAVAQLIHLLLIGILDPSPLGSYRAAARGVRDYVARKAGPFVEHAR
jgi:rhamnosyltransferase